MCSAIFRSCLEPLLSLLDEAGISRDQLDHVGLPHLMHIHESHGHFTDLHMLKFPFLFFSFPFHYSNFYSNLTIYTRFLLPSSALTPPPSLLPLTPPPSLLPPHSSPSLLPPHSSPLTPPPHSSPLTPPPHSSSLTPHHSLLPPHSPHTHTGLAGWGQLQNPSTAAAVQRRVPLLKPPHITST